MRLLKLIELTNEHGITCLHVCFTYGNEKALKYILDLMMGDKDMLQRIANKKDVADKTALTFALQ